MSSLVKQYLRAHPEKTVGELFRAAWMWDHDGRDPTSEENRKIIEATTNFRTKKDYPAPPYVDKYLQTGGKKKAPPQPYIPRPFWAQ